MVIFGSTMVDLAKVYAVDVSLVSSMMLANNVGYMIGTLAGWTYRWINRQLALIFATLLMATTIFILPYCPAIWIAYVVYFLNGLGFGIYGSSSAIWFIDMWPKGGTTAVLLGSQLIYGLGSIFTPTMVAHFVFGESNQTASGEWLDISLRRSYLVIPYWITAAIQTLPSILLLVLYFIWPWSKRRHSPALSPDSLATDNQTSASGSHIKHRNLKLTLSILCFSVYFTAETGYLPYATTMWQYSEIALSAAEANHVAAILATTYTTGPIITAAFSIWITIDSIITFQYGFLAGGCAMLFFGRDNRLAIYIGSAIIGYGMSSMIPSLISFSDRHFRLGNRSNAINSFGSGLISLAIPLLVAGQLREHPLILLAVTATFFGDCFTQIR